MPLGNLAGVLHGVASRGVLCQQGRGVRFQDIKGVRFCIPFGVIITSDTPPSLFPLAFYGLVTFPGMAYKMPEKIKDKPFPGLAVIGKK